MTPVQWSDLLQRIQTAKFSDVEYGNRFITVQFDKTHYAFIYERGGLLNVELYRRVRVGSDYLLESWNGLRGLNSAVTSLRRAKLTLQEAS